jgi:predicted anti-sigma-YlaC factor YlaD
MDLIDLLNDATLRAEIARGVVPILSAVVALAFVYMLADLIRHLRRK